MPLQSNAAWQSVNYDGVDGSSSRASSKANVEALADGMSTPKRFAYAGYSFLSVRSSA
jgi:hypothetical protein